MDKIFDASVNLGYSTDEPTLREIIYRYYHKHFPATEADDYTEQLIAKLKETAGSLS